MDKKKLQNKKANKKPSTKINENNEIVDEGLFGSIGRGFAAAGRGIANKWRNRNNVDNNVASILLYVVAEIHNSEHRSPRDVSRLPMAYSYYVKMYNKFKSDLSISKKGALESMENGFEELKMTNPATIKSALSMLLKHYDYAIKKFREENMAGKGPSLRDQEQGDGVLEPSQRPGRLGESKNLNLLFKPSKKGVFKLLLEAGEAAAETPAPPRAEAPATKAAPRGPELIAQEEYREILLHFFQSLGHNYTISPDVVLPTRGTEYKPKVDYDTEFPNAPNVGDEEAAGVQRRRGEGSGQLGAASGDGMSAAARAESEPTPPRREHGVPLGAFTDKFDFEPGTNNLILKVGTKFKVGDQYYEVTPEGKARKVS